MNKHVIVSFDIGKINFAFHIEEFDATQLEKVKNIPKIKRYNVDGTCTKEFENIIDKICMNGKTLLYKNSDISQGCKKGSTFDPKLCINMTELLDQYKSYWDRCNKFIIEMQMNFGKRRNTTAVKLAQHCMSYFLFNYKDANKVIEFPAYHKTQVLGAGKIKSVTKTGKVTYKAIDKPARKKWSIDEACRMLSERGEIDIFCDLSTKSKKDDLSDCLLMNCAYKYLHYIEKSL